MLTINTITTRKVGEVMMIIGGSIFGIGLGTTIVSNVIDHGQAKAFHKNERLTIETEALKQEKKLTADNLLAETHKNEALAEKIEKMDKKEFAKYHAESVAKASEEALTEANKIKAKAASDVSEMELECSKKVSEAVQEAADAKNKYNELLLEYKNRDEVLKAKEEIKKFLSVTENQKNEMADLKNKLAILV